MSVRRRMVLVLAALAALAGPERATAGPERGTIASAFHIHSTWSTGVMSLDQLAENARRQRLGAILLSENFLLRLQYDLPPFRTLTRVYYRGGADVMDAGLDRYLAAVAEAQRRHADIVFVPGVEVMPHYRWSGSPFTLDLLLEDTQKNLLVFGLRDRATLAALPALGNPAAGEIGWPSLLDALPIALVVPGALLVLRRQTRRARVGAAAFTLVRRRRWRLGGVLLAVGIVAFVRAWPFTVDRYPSWTNPGVEPYQELIDYADRAGGLTVWSFPEAKDEGEHEFGPVRVRRHTAPYPDDLLRTARYTAFGAVYEDATTFERPGGLWDRLLGQFTAGRRSRAVWGVGEMGYHDNSASKWFGAVQTVFLDAERSEAGVLDAFRGGRMYAIRRTPEVGLALTEFSITSRGQAAMTAGTLRAAPGAELDVRVGVAASDAGSHDVRVSLVRNGAVIQVWAARTPFREVYRDTVAAGRAFYRVDVRGAPPQTLVTNPIFVTGP